MKNAIAISIVMPVYNEEKTIQTALQSLIDQDFNNAYEILVVDNNSTDQTTDIVKKLRPRFANLRLVKESQQGVVFARQKGLMSARGDIIVGADADSWYPKNYLTRIHKNFQKDKAVVVVGGEAQLERNPWWMYWFYIFGFKLIGFIYHHTGYVLYLTANNFAFRRNAFLQIGGYDTRFGLGGGDEIDALARLKKTGKVVYDPQLKNKTSARRYRQGFIKLLFIHCLYNYWLNYWLSRLFKKKLITEVAVRE